jgi:hypothetical protein
MGFNSYDDLVSEMTTGKTTGPVTWNKLVPAAHVAGRWYDFQALAGTPIANAWAGTALNWITCTGSTGNGTQIFGLPVGGDVSTDTKHIINAMEVTPGVVPGVLMLVDLQGYYPGISLNSATAQTMVGTPTLRYTDGAGIRAYFVVTGGTVGAGAHNIAMSYTNQAGTGSRTLPVTVACTASTIATHITHSGVAANNYGPFLPLASGDSGIRSVQTVTFSASSSGTAPLGALCLARPLLTLPITTTGVAVERDLVNQIPSLPQIKDGACLVWIYMAGGTTASNTNFYGTIECAWG